MKFSTVVLAAAAGVAANKNVTYVTEVVDVYTTYCPEATQITHGTKTWTVTAVCFTLGEERGGGLDGIVGSAFSLEIC